MHHVERQGYHCTPDEVREYREHIARLAWYFTEKHAREWDSRLGHTAERESNRSAN